MKQINLLKAGALCLVLCLFSQLCAPVRAQAQAKKNVPIAGSAVAPDGKSKAVAKLDLAHADGTFETVAGWSGIDGVKSMVETEKGNRFLRVRNDKPEESVFIGGRFALDSAWKRVTLSAKLRGTIAAKGKEDWYAPHLAFQFQSADQKMVGGWPPVLSLAATSAEWIEVSRTYDVPAGATSISLGPGLWGTSGTFDIDDLTVTSGDTNIIEKAPALKDPLRILTLGDSITAIFRYQASLRESLKAEGIEAEFVGSGGEGEKKHEGHSGWSIGGIEDNVTKYLSDSNANVVLLQIGVNNMHHGLGVKGKDYPPYQEGVQGQGARPGKTLDELGASWGAKNYGSGYLTDRVNGLLDKILNHPNAPLLVVAKIPGIGLGDPLWKTENDAADARIREFNTILEAAVKARQAKGQKVEIVDNYVLGNRAYGSGPEFTWGTQEQQSGDWVHPRAESAIWKGMATNFNEGLKRLRKR